MFQFFSEQEDWEAGTEMDPETPAQTSGSWGSRLQTQKRLFYGAQTGFLEGSPPTGKINSNVGDQLTKLL